MPLAALCRLTPRPGEEAELLTRLLDVAVDVRTEPGNLVTLVLRDPEQPGDVLMFEVFLDQAAIVAHREAQHSIDKGPAVHALLDTPMRVQRFETIERAG